MALTPYDRILNSVRPHLPGAMDQAIKQEFFLLALDFFKRSDVWWEDIDITSDGKTDHEVIPTMGRLNRLLWVNDADGNRYGATMPTKGTLRFGVAPDAGRKFVATFSLTVNDPVDNSSFPLVPYELVEMYTDEFVSGLLYRMMVQPAKPYTNMSLAAAYRMQYNSGLGRARNDKLNENTAAVQRWRFPRFA